MAQDNNNKNVRPRLKFLGAAIGDLSNEKIKTCDICRKNDFPHEPITFERITGRMLSNCSNETIGWKLKNYVTDRPHEHRERSR